MKVTLTVGSRFRSGSGDSQGREIEREDEVQNSISPEQGGQVVHGFDGVLGDSILGIGGNEVSNTRVTG